MTQDANTPPKPNGHFKPKLHEIHTDPTVAPATNQPLAQTVAAQPAETKSAARWAYERLILYIKNFEEQLDKNQAVAMGFTGSDAGVLRIEGMGYFDPDIVTFYGSDQTGGRTQLVQHVSQLNVMLRAVPITIEEEEEPTRIGFRLAEDLDENEPARS